ncbi:DUF421 domain-containing protein [Bacillus thermotolerans]|uniref:YrbG like protein n=1 Tax=Bacillus thermotolerans TaxID=1221996 RepID=A0A0F5ICX2_BACTR|nr:DUF421 domain-containing protein [Bacillus thermotolerans]KKB39686.1 yrbG like protein [Bacillus thermotolerans]KKB43439.1 yrbG like protein [Bacillus thermotolerans]
MTYLTIIFRAVFLYIVILLIFRLMGRREIGELSILDLVVFLMIGEMAVVAIEQHTDPLLHSLIPMFTLVIIQLTLAHFSLKSVRFREMVEGKPEIIIDKGKINEKAMKRQRYNFHDLLLQLREKDIRYIEEVEYAILEPSGSLSIMKKDENGKSGTFTLPLILDGVVQYEHLKMINQTEQWLKQELKRRGYKQINRISFCSFDNGQFFIDEKDQ